MLSGKSRNVFLFAEAHVHTASAISDPLVETLCVAIYSTQYFLFRGLLSLPLLEIWYDLLYTCAQRRPTTDRRVHNITYWEKYLSHCCEVSLDTYPSSPCPIPGCFLTTRQSATAICDRYLFDTCTTHSGVLWVCGIYTFKSASSERVWLV